jgi:hypothetical protein
VPGAVVTLLARLEHEQDPTLELASATVQDSGGADKHRGMGVMTASVHDAVDRARVLEPGVSSDIGSASMSARNNTVGPGWSPSRIAVIEVSDVPVRICSPRPASASSTRS